MTAAYAKNTRVRNAVTPQVEPIPGREAEMAQNHAGGFVFAIDNWSALDRFLILGTEGGTYYASERKATKEMIPRVAAAIAEDGERVVRRVVEISTAGRAPKTDPALLVLAMCAAAADSATRKLALLALPKVARIGTHLFHFAEFVDGFRGWGPALRKAVGDWYLAKSADSLGFQVVKYQQRDGWSHRDLLRKAHPKVDADDAPRRALFDWICRRREGVQDRPLPDIVKAFDEMQAATAIPDVLRIIAKFETGGDDGEERGFPREAIPTQWLSDGRVWGMLLRNMPMTAMIRNLGTMSKAGVLDPLGVGESLVLDALGDRERLKKARVHPLSILLALKTYSSGRGFRSESSWPVNQSIVAALDRAFYATFANVEPTGKRFLLGLDVSGSMDSVIAGTNISCREAVGALAMVTSRTEPRTHMVGFASGGGSWFIGGATAIVELDFSRASSLEDVCGIMKGIPFGATDCSLPILHAMERGIPVDVFVVMTDNETFAGKAHPAQALREYRKKMGIEAKMIVVGMTSTGFSIADPNDTGMLDVVGFDSALPDLVRMFVAA
jgi:60 kDa SS-A/Ro ribonucleoprotein